MMIVVILLVRQLGLRIFNSQLFANVINSNNAYSNHFSTQRNRSIAVWPLIVNCQRVTKFVKICNEAVACMPTKLPKILIFPSYDRLKLVSTNCKNSQKAYDFPTRDNICRHNLFRGGAWHPSRPFFPTAQPRHGENQDMCLKSKNC